RMRDLAVVALEEVLADDLPVRVDLGLPARVEDEVVDVEAELGDLRRHRAERVRERLRVAVGVHEDERPPRADGDAAEPELVLREVRLLVRARRGAERAVEPVRPRVVGALERLALPGALGQREAAVPADVEERPQLAVARPRHDDGSGSGARREERAGFRQLPEMPGVLPRRAEDPLLLAAENLGVPVPAVGESALDWLSLSPYDGAVETVRKVGSFVKAHPRAVVALQLVVLAVFFGSLGWAMRGAFKDAGTDLRNADPVLFVLACAVLAVYYLVFVLGWMRILWDWKISISYPAALRAEMVSMLAKYVPGGVWTPAARVVAARRAGITDAALVTVSILVEAGISAVAGVVVFVVSLAWVRGVDAPLAPLIAFAVIVSALLHPRIFCPLASRVLRRLGHGALPPLRVGTMAFLLLFYCGTWVIGGSALWLLLRAVGAHPAVSSIVFLGGVAAVGAIVAVLAVFAPSGLGPREASMYGLMLAITTQGAALSATVLNRVAITVVEILLFVLGGLILRKTEGETEPTAQPIEG